jgi:broad-specificity NMP kinase
MTVTEATAVVLVTGVSGSGKSAIARRLTAMGRDAISMDADEQLTGWHDTATGQRVARPDVPDAEWLAEHEWRWDPGRLDAIIADARGRNVDVLFLCGHAANGLDLADRFDACLLLEIDRATMTQRLRDPSRGNVYGRTDATHGHALAAACWAAVGLLWWLTGRLVRRRRRARAAVRPEVTLPSRGLPSTPDRRDGVPRRRARWFSCNHHRRAGPAPCSRLSSNG